MGAASEDCNAMQHVRENCDEAGDLQWPPSIRAPNVRTTGSLAAPMPPLPGMVAAAAAGATAGAGGGGALPAVEEAPAVVLAAGVVVVRRLGVLEGAEGDCWRFLLGAILAMLMSPIWRML